MLQIDTEKMIIELTRGDTASIVFSAVDTSGETYVPSIGEIIKFAVAKKVGAEPISEVENVGTSDNIKMVEIYEEATPTEEEFDEDPTKYYTEEDGEYTQCEVGDEFDEDTQYYTQEVDIDATDFWTITIGDVEDNFWVDENGADKYKFADYVWDVQLTTSTGVDTIIGKTSDISPIFRVLGEVATE